MSKNEIYKKIEVEIKGLTPLLMNRLNPESLKSKTRMKMEQYSTETDAKNSAYIADIDGKRQLYIPQEALYSMIIQTAKQYKVKRMSLASLLAGTMRVEPEKVPLGTDQYEVDERAVVIQSMRVLKGRAKLKDWAAKFQLVYDSRRLPEGIGGTLKEILEDAGTRMGLLDYRPQHRGWFGTFEVVSFVPQQPREVEEVMLDEAVFPSGTVEVECSAVEVASPSPDKPKRGRPPKAVIA
jgi:hypothetical protein